MAKPIVIAGLKFPFRYEAEAYCGEILNDGNINTRILGADAEFVEMLWLHRPDKLEEFAGLRVVGFERRYRDGKEKWTRCFWAVFEDGQATDFSFKKALRNIVAHQHPSRL